MFLLHTPLFYSTKMDARLDKIDFDIVNSLMEDGRKSFRQISREIGISTPTIEIRFTRLKELGIIKDIQPIFDFEKFKGVTFSIIYIKTEPTESDNVIKELVSFAEVTNLYMATGEHNLIAMVMLYDQSQLEDIRQKISGIKGIKSLYYQILNKIIKNEPINPIQKESVMRILCEICGEPIHSFSYKINVGDSEKYLCCSSCLTLYKQKHSLK